MYGCDSWTTKKAECPRINAFELWCWNRLLRVPWAAKRSNQSILKEISCEYSLEGLMQKLKLRYFGYLMWRTDSLGRSWFWERLKSGGKGDDRGWDGWKASLTWWTWVWASSSSWWWTGKHAAAYEVAKSRTRLSDWTELNWHLLVPFRCLVDWLMATSPGEGTLLYLVWRFKCESRPETPSYFSYGEIMLSQLCANPSQCPSLTET